MADQQGAIDGIFAGRIAANILKLVGCQRDESSEPLLYNAAIVPFL